MTQTPEPPATGAPFKPPPSLLLVPDEEGKVQLDVAGDWSVLLKAAGSLQLLHRLLGQVATLGAHGERLSEEASAVLLGFASAMKPRDAAELLLLLQMGAIHRSTMMLARRLNHVETLPQQDAAERALNKLARTFAGQMEALKRYRAQGTQVVRVERVTVESGAQAVVGNVTQGGRGGDER